MKKQNKPVTEAEVMAVYKNADKSDREIAKMLGISPLRSSYILYKLRTLGVIKADRRKRGIWNEIVSKLKH